MKVSLITITTDNSQWIAKIPSPNANNKTLAKIDNLRKLICKKFTPDNPSTNKLIRVFDELAGFYPGGLFKAIDMIGEKAFIYNLRNNQQNLNELVSSCSYAKPDQNDDIEAILPYTNPTNSRIYNELGLKIKSLKKNYTSHKGDKQKLVNDINTLTKQKYDLVKNSIKDPQIMLTAAIIYEKMQNVNSEDASKIIKNFSELKDLNKIADTSFLNSLIYYFCDMKDVKPETVARFDLTNSKYLLKTFSAYANTRNNIKNLIKILDLHPDKSTREILNSLPHNLKTKEIFESYGINYDKYTAPNPGLFIDFKTDLTLDSKQESIMKSLIGDLKELYFSNDVPEEERNLIFDSLAKAGLVFVKNTENRTPDISFSNNHNLLYYYNGVEYRRNDSYTQASDGLNSVNKPYTTGFYGKNNAPLKFSELKNIVIKIREIMDNTPFWKVIHTDEALVSGSKEYLKMKLYDLRYNELKTIQKESLNERFLRIQKTDMNNLTHSIFLGNDAGECCVSVNKNQGWTAPEYILTKAVGAIEIRDSKDYIGNVMYIIAKVDGKPSLILDNTELKSDYHYNPKIREMIFEFARNITKDIGLPEMPVYLASGRQKISTEGLFSSNKEIEFISESSDNGIYLDFMNGKQFIKEGLKVKQTLYSIYEP